MKISILWASLAGYTVEFYKSLALDCGCTVQLFYMPVKPDAPYHPFDLSFCAECYELTGSNDYSVVNKVSEFQPSCIIVASWNFKNYMKTCFLMRKLGVFILSTADNQWRGTWKQYFGILISPFYLRKRIDAFLVAGDRQASFVRKLGFKKIIYGMYAANVSSFVQESIDLLHERSFIFVGRLTASKGVDKLLKAYDLYCKARQNPWKLKIIGTGPLKYLFDNNPNVDYLGFIQPSDLPSFFHKSTCFILPSIYEPWGLVIHEAAAAGLPIVCTYTCGASTAFVRDGLNGFIINPTVDDIFLALYRISSLSAESLSLMSQYSKKLGLLWTPPMLARYVVDFFRFNTQATRLF